MGFFGFEAKDDPKHPRGPPWGDETLHSFIPTSRRGGREESDYILKGGKHFHGLGTVHTILGAGRKEI